MESTATQSAIFNMDLHDPAQRAEVERALEGVTGMVAVRLVAGFDRPIDELHALVAGDRSPKQVVRDVQSLLYTRFDVSIDHRVISVVQLADDDPIVTAQVSQQQRVALTRVSLTQSASEVSVTVVVTDADGIEHVGTTSDDVSPHRQHLATGHATILAVEDILEPASVLTLSGVEVVRCGGMEVAVAVVNVRAARTHQALTGSAVVRQGAVDAVARAVLDALNRTLPLP